MNTLREMIDLIERRTSPAMSRMEAWKLCEEDLPRLNWNSFKRVWSLCHRGVR